MSIEWWKLSPQELARDAEAMEQRRLDYFNTLYASPQGRHVLLDFQKYCYGRYGNLDNMKPEQYAAALGLIAFYGYMRTCCGMTDEEAVISAEARLQLNPG